jgi:transposase
MKWEKLEKVSRVVYSDEYADIRKKLVSDIIAFLQLFIPATLAKRITSVLLLVAGVPHECVSEWTGSCDRSVRQWRKEITTGNTDKLLVMGTGAGRKSKLADIEAQVLAEIENKNYHTLQQIADMVKEKFNIAVSTMAVHRFLKKTGSND